MKAAFKWLLKGSLGFWVYGFGALGFWGLEIRGLGL